MAYDIQEISINILSVASRPCRRYQEKIVEYGMDGRPRFEWEILRHDMILYGTQTLPEVCSYCNLNIMQGAEGCKGTIFGLNVFLRVVASLVPDSPWANLELNGEPLSDEQTMELREDLDNIERVFAETDWKVAQLYYDDEPLMDYFDDGSSRPKLYPWNGEAPPYLINGNEGYQVFICSHGILVKSNFEELAPHVFTRLYRDMSGVYGETLQGETVGFQSTMARYPEWNKEDPKGLGELRFVDMKASEVFRDTLDMLIVYTGVAADARTGITISSE